jgi:nucleotide-binding universal stress UspA family protein
MFSRMLVATDLSEASDRVIGTLGGLKALGTCDAVLIHCFNVRDIGALAPRQIDAARSSFEKQTKLLEGQGFQVAAEMVFGLPPIEIAREADGHDCSLIGVGSHGETMAGEIKLGGVASAIIHSATHPVLIVRLRLKDDGGRTVLEGATCDPLKHVLFPTDFSDNAEHAFSYVEKIAECGARRITLLHVQDKLQIDRYLKDRLQEFKEIDTERLERLRAELVKRRVRDVRIQLPYGSPKQEIIEQTKRDDVSLVVMGSQGRGFLAEFFLGSVSLAVARHSEVPVLLVPAIR